MSEIIFAKLRIKTVSGQQWIANPKIHEIHGLQCYEITHRRVPTTAFQETTYKWEKRERDIPSVYVTLNNVEQLVELSEQEFEQSLNAI